MPTIKSVARWLRQRALKGGAMTHDALTAIHHTCAPSIRDTLRIEHVA